MTIQLVRLELYHVATLRQIAEEEGCPVEYVIEEFVREGIERYEKRRAPRSEEEVAALHAWADQLFT